MKTVFRVLRLTSLVVFHHVGLMRVLWKIGEKDVLLFTNFFFTLEVRCFGFLMFPVSKARFPA